MEDFSSASAVASRVPAHRTQAWIQLPQHGRWAICLSQWVAQDAFPYGNMLKKRQTRRNCDGFYPDSFILYGKCPLFACVSPEESNLAFESRRETKMPTFTIFHSTLVSSLAGMAQGLMQRTFTTTHQTHRNWKPFPITKSTQAPTFTWTWPAVPLTSTRRTGRVSTSLSSSISRDETIQHGPPPKPLCRLRESCCLKYELLCLSCCVRFHGHFQLLKPTEQRAACKLDHSLDDLVG